ncbi:hypothetical protein C8039_07570 [Halogeometricum sp. wsp3]|nr:hypothetical protein C8039_07570 [Halogeometricum sp. wsp3]
MAGSPIVRRLRVSRYRRYRWLVNRRVANASDTNDNGATGSISGNQLAAGDQTLDAGTYYLEDLTLSGETLTINTGGDDVTIAVRDYVYIENNGRIKVNGGGKVRLYVKGEAMSPSGHHFHIYRTGDVDIDNANNSKQFGCTAGRTLTPSSRETLIRRSLRA